MMVACESEELAQHRQAAGPVFRQLGEERLDIGDVCEGPILFAALGIEEAG
ncbi:MULTISPECIES: hypothetical protein [Mycobacterium]|uniref:Uncharacterized protein n=1 Tax=Mycobacterium servetii TaxID=3237418 RepID=A0ABV4C4E8_9MYCO|nr:hypothetical protein [Mycobacterium helveticum]